MYKEIVEKEIEIVLKKGITELASSECALPIGIIKKEHDIYNSLMCGLPKLHT